MKLLSKTLLALYLLFLLWLVLFKFSVDLSSVFDSQTRTLNLAPFTDLSPNTLREMISNFVAFVPFGLLLGVNFNGAAFWRKLLLIFMFSLVVEAIQYMFAIGVTDITDVITNTFGGFLGLTLYGLGQRFHHERTDRLVVVVCVILLILLFSLLLSQRIRLQLVPTATTSPLQTTLAKDVQLAWPEGGQAAIGSVEDGVLARSSDGESPQPTASMAKVITALAIMEKQPLEIGETGKSYKLTSKDVAHYHAEIARGGSAVAVHEGLVLTQYQAMQAMLIGSANNIADTLVEREFGSVKAYAAYAQNMLERMGLSQTVVVDASGFSPATVSTPSELVAIGIAALKNPVIAEIVAQPQAQIPSVGIVKNTNELLGGDGVVGIKTGTTAQAGNCLLFAASYTTNDSGRKVTLVGVIMDDTNAATLFNDSRALLASARQGLDLVNIHSENDTITPSPRQMDRIPR